MASLRAHLFVAAVKRAARAPIGRKPELAKVREVFGQRGLPPPSDVVYERGTVAGVPGEWLTAKSARRAAPVLLYLHGGGFVGCSARGYRPITAELARAGFRVFSADYRLAPEHPFPAALTDALAVWTALASQGPAVIAGDSAGGNIALGAMLAARARSIALPWAAALFSPVTDLAGRSASIAENATRDGLFYPETLRFCGRVYLDGADPLDPRASPIEADLTGLPPLLIHVAEREMLRDDSLRFAARAAEAGLRVELKVWPVVPHAWQLGGRFLPEARDSLGQAAAFLMSEVERASRA